MKQIKHIVKWINSCKTYEQLVHLKNYIEGQYLVTPDVLSLVIRNKETILRNAA